MAEEFEEQAGFNDEMTALARGLHEQAQASGITKDAEGEAPRAEDHDPRAILDKRIAEQAAESQLPAEPLAGPAAEAATAEKPAEEKTEAAAEEPAETEETEETEATDEEVFSADAVIRLEDGREVTARELAEGSMMQADYTRKTQELASQRAEMEQQSQAILSDYQQRTTQLGQLANSLQVEINAYNNPAEMQQLAIDDPGEYAKRTLQNQQRAQMIAVANHQQEELNERQQQARVPYERQALTQKNKAFADNFETTYRSVGEWVLDPSGGGLSPEIWNGVYDHRFVDIAHKAMLWDRMQHEATSEVAPRIREHAQRKPTIVRAGVSQPAKSSRSKASEDYQRALGDTEAMRTTSGIAEAFLARDRLRSSGG